MLRCAAGIKIVLLVLISFGITNSVALCQIAAWDFTGASSAATWAATTFNSNLVSTSGANTITRGSGASASTGGNSFRTVGFQNNGISTANTDYFQVTLKAASGYTISLSSLNASFAGTGTFCASPGVSAQFAYSLDGSTFTLIGSAFTLIGTPATMSAISLSSITALQNVSSSTTIYLRYYASGQTTTGGWGFFSASSGSNGLAIGGSVDAAGGCSGTPTAGTATASSYNICSGNTTVLSLSGASRGAGITYQWQSSTSGAGGSFSNISGATDTAYTTPALSANRYYNCMTTCSTSALSATSNTDTITVTTTVTPSITIAASPTGAVCSGTTVTYTASPSNGGGSPAYQWKKGGTNITGATNATYSYPPANGDVITCVLTSNATCASPLTATSTGITMTVNPLPSPTISGTITISSGGSAVLTFNGSSADTVYYWNGSSSNNVTVAASGSASVTVSPTATTTYSITSARAATGCSQTISGQFATVTVTTGSASDTIPTRDDNMALGNPSGATTSTSNVNNYLMVKSQYALSYNDSKGMANWVSWHLSRAWKNNTVRCDCFTQDATLPSGYYRASTGNYTGTGFDRGHLCPSDDRDSTSTDNAATFLMTNISPQAPNMNQVTWGNLEEYCRDLIYRGNELYIIAGDYGSGGSGSSGGTTTSIASGNISVPSHFWKVIVVLPVGVNDVSRITTTTRVIAVIMPNTQTVNTQTWDYYTTTIDSIESLTGYDFLSNVSTGIQSVLEAKKDSRLLAWDFTGTGAYTSYYATVVNSHLDSSTAYNTVTRGSSASASTGANSFRTTGFQNNGISTSNTDYFQVKIKASTGYSVSLSSIEGTFNGTASFFASPGVTGQYAYSLDGTTFTLIGSPVTTASLTPPTVALTGISALQNVPSTSTIYIRYYASGQTTTGGWGFDSPFSDTYGLDIGGSVNISGCSGTPASGTIVVSSDTICSGNTDTLSLSTTSTGLGITYQWQSSTTGAGGSFSNISGATNINYITPSLSAATYYKCVTTCTTSALSSTSATAPVIIRASVTPAITIAASPSGSICAGTSVTFTATPVNGGTSPAYQWKKGGINISGATNATYTYSPANGDIITCALTSSVLCPSPATVTSSGITMSVNSTVTPSVTIAASPSGAVCSGTSVTFTATPTNGGTSPVYQWKLGGSNISGATNTTYTYTPTNGDAITCQLTSNAVCVSTVTATSAVTTMTVNPTPPSGGTITGTTALATGTTTSLSNPSASSGSISWASSNTAIATVNSTTGVVTGISAGNAIITYTVTTSCGTGSDTALINVTAAPATIAAWDFFGVTSSSPPATYAATTFNGNLVTTSGANNITRGSTAGANGANNAFRTTGFQNNGIATSNTDYFQVTLKATTGYTLSLSTINASFAGTASFCASPGVTSQFAYSLDGSSFTLIGSSFALVGTPVSMSAINLSGISALQNVGASTTIYLRYYASGQTTTGGWGFISSASGNNGLAIGGVVNPVPCSGTPAHATATGSTTICSGNTANLALSGFSTGSGISYQWQNSSTGTTGSFSNISGATDTAYTTPALSATRYYRCITTCSFSSSSDSSANATISVNPLPNAGAISGATLACVGSSITLTTTGSGGTWSSSNTAIATVSSGGIVTGNAPGTAIISYTATNSCGTAIATYTTNSTAMQWVGGTTGSETDWNTATNWSCGFVPTAGLDVIIPAGTTYIPVIASGSGTVRNLTIASGAMLSIGSSALINVKGSLTHNGTIAGAGYIKLNGTSAQTISGRGNVNKIELNNTSGAAIGSGAKLTINQVLTLTSGTFTTNDSVVLNSDNTQTAFIAPITTGASVNGNITVKQYVQGGMRRYRFWSHPFNHAIPLSQLEDDIDVTGTGGSANGFTTTASNAPSAYRYNPLVGNSSLPSDPGWRPFTSAYGATDSNRLNRHQGIRLFMRGAKGEGLGYASYTPSPVIISMTGAINQGNQTITLTKGTAANQDYNMLGNPYPSPVDIGTVVYNAWSTGNIAGAAYYIWNPSMGAAGQYQAIPINTVVATPYYLQANTAFQVRAAHNGDTLNFSENNKSATVTSVLFKEQKDNITLAVYDNNYHLYNKLNLRFSETATPNEDSKLDATLLPCADFNFYSLSTDNKKMVLDTRPFEKEITVPLGINSSYEQEYIIKAENVNVPGFEVLYLHDKLNRQYIPLQSGAIYSFSVTKLKETQGDNRFEITTQSKPGTDFEASTSIDATVSPSPFVSELNIVFTTLPKEKVVINVYELSGKRVHNQNLGLLAGSKVTLTLAHLSSGSYLLEITSGSEKKVIKVVKE